MSKQLANLIDKFGADKLHQMIDDHVKAELDLKRLWNLFHDPATNSAEEFLEDWADSKGLKLEHNTDFIQIKHWNSDGPYVYLWTHDYPGFEIGQSIYKIWSVDGLEDLTNKLERIYKMRETYHEHFDIPNYKELA